MICIPFQTGMRFGPREENVSEKRFRYQRSQSFHSRARAADRLQLCTRLRWPHSTAVKLGSVSKGKKKRKKKKENI